MKKLLLAIFLLFIMFIYLVYIGNIPNILCSNNKNNYGFRKIPFITLNEVIETVSGDDINKVSLEVKLFDTINLKTVSLVKLDDLLVVPVGKVVGLKLYTNGVLVVGKSEIESIDNKLIKPYDDIDINEGDIILQINDRVINSTNELKECINDSNGDMLNLLLLRNGEYLARSIKPVYTYKKDYKIGLWVKDSATGVGTLSFFIPKNNIFAMLGHGITDNDTDELLKIDYGELVTSKILYLQKSMIGVPGEIKGTIINQDRIGEVKVNSPFGVYGKLDDISKLNIETSKKYHVAYRDEIELGEAKVICSLDNLNVKEYKINIELINLDNDYNNKSMQIKITDEGLLSKTGGIVRGLSGAPIIQNDKLVGVITNVLVSNPCIGYAIFGDIMIKEIDNIEN